MPRSTSFVLALSVALPSQSLAQVDSTAPIIDTIIVDGSNIFAPDQARGGFNWLMNAIHVPTKPYVVRQNLLFTKGDRYDPTLFQHSARNLRDMGIFSTVEIDTLRVGDSFAARVAVRDAISLSPTIGFSSTGATVTWALGLTDANLLGTGNLVSGIYRQEVDRSGLDLGAQANRMFGSQIDLDASWSNWSDGNVGYVLVGDPFRSDIDPRSIVYVFGGADRRVLQYRASETLDTTTYWQTGVFNRVDAYFAPLAELRHVRRVGLAVQLKAEEFVLVADTGMAVPDSLTAAVGAAFELERSDFLTITPQFNGVGRTEDLNLSKSLRLGVWLAPGAFGYARTGIGPEFDLSIGVGGRRIFNKLELEADGLFSGAGLDSGRVDVRVTFGVNTAKRHWDLLYVTGGVQENPPPGGEYDLGAGSASASQGCGNASLCDAAGRFREPPAFIGPRLFTPHSFVGTRTVWGTYEHRWFLIDDIIGWFGLGVAGFFDYGGAWYAAQDPRSGGNVGAGLRIGGIRGRGASLVRLDIGYRFGDLLEGDESGFVLGVGKAFVY